MVDMREIEKKAYEVLKGVWVEGIYQYMDLPVLVVTVDGDWKHDHMRADWLIKEHLNGTLLKVNEIGDSEDDSFCAERYYSFI